MSVENVTADDLDQIIRDMDGWWPETRDRILVLIRDHDSKVRAEEREKAAQIAEDAPGTEATGYYAGDHQAGYQEAQTYIAARIREQS